MLCAASVRYMLYAQKALPEGRAFVITCYTLYAPSIRLRNSRFAGLSIASLR